MPIFLPDKYPTQPYRLLATCPNNTPHNLSRGSCSPANRSLCTNSYFAGAPTYQTWTAPFLVSVTGTPDSGSGRVVRCRFPASFTMTGTVTPGSDPGGADRWVRASPTNKRLWIKSYYAGVPTYQIRSDSASVTVLLLYATMTEVGLTARSCASSVILLVLLSGEPWPRGERRGSQRGERPRRPAEWRPSSSTEVEAAVQFWLRRRSPSASWWDHSIPESVDRSFPILSSIPLISPAVKLPKALGGTTLQLCKLMNTCPSIPRRRPPSTSRWDRLCPRICSSSSFAAQLDSWAPPSTTLFIKYERTTQDQILNYLLSSIL